MRQSTVFWIFSTIFILSCVIVILYGSITRRNDEIYIRDITAETTVSGIENGEISDIVLGKGDNLKSGSVSKPTVEKININTASAEELTALPGIGEAIAERIVEYRNECGNFLNIEEIMDVSGIGEGKFEAIKDLIEV